MQVPKKVDIFNPRSRLVRQKMVQKDGVDSDSTHEQQDKQLMLLHTHKKKKVLLINIFMMIMMISCFMLMMVLILILVSVLSKRNLHKLCKKEESNQEVTHHSDVQFHPNYDITSEIDGSAQ